jgi:hypothetical protein
MPAIIVVWCIKPCLGDGLVTSCNPGLAISECSLPLVFVHPAVLIEGEAPNGIVEQLCRKVDVLEPLNSTWGSPAELRLRQPPYH